MDQKPESVMEFDPQRKKIKKKQKKKSAAAQFYPSFQCLLTTAVYLEINSMLTLMKLNTSIQFSIQKIQFY